MKAKKNIIFSVLVFFMIFSYEVKASFWDNIMQSANQAVDITAGKVLDITLKELPEDVTVDYEKITADIKNKSFFVNNVLIKVRKASIKSDIFVKQIKVLEVDVLKALSGEKTNFKQAVLINADIKDLRKSSDNIIKWKILFDKIEMNNVVFSDSKDEIISADNIFLFNLNAEKKENTKNVTKYYSADNIAAYDFKMKQKAEKNIDVFDLVSFEKALVNNKEIYTFSDLFNLIKSNR